MAKLTGLNVSVFTVGAVLFIDMLQDATYSIENVDEDGSAVNEAGEDPELVKRRRTITAEMLVDAESEILQLAEGNNPVVAFSFDSGGNTYAGNGLISTAGHRVANRTLQRQTVTIKVKGTPTVTAPA